MKNISPPLDTLVRLYHEEKLTLQEIGDRYGLTRQAIQDRLRRAGVPRRPRSVPPQQLDDKRVHELYVVRGLTITDVARELGVSPGRVSSHLKRAGIKARRLGRKSQNRR